MSVFEYTCVCVYFKVFVEFVLCVKEYFEYRERIIMNNIDIMFDYMEFIC